MASAYCPRPFRHLVGAAFLAASLLLPNLVQAADPPAPAAPATEAKLPEAVEKPLLWKIEGNGLQKPSYLFGTIHLSDARVTTLHPSAQAAFDGADRLYTEVGMEAKHQLDLTLALMRQDGKQLDQVIGAEMAADLNAELAQIQPGLTSAPLQMLKTWGVAIVLPSLGDQLKGGEPLDKQLWNRARTGGKKLGALETIAGHVGGMDTLNDEEQKLLLASSIKSLREMRTKGEDPHAKLLGIYLRGDEGAIAKLEAEELAAATEAEKALAAKVMKLLLDERNARMAEVMVKRMKAYPEQSCFFAAGTAHFAGDQRIQLALEKAGYTVTRVEAPAAKPEAKPAAEPKPEAKPAAPQEAPRKAA